MKHVVTLENFIRLLAVALLSYAIIFRPLSHMFSWKHETLAPSGKELEAAQTTEQGLKLLEAAEKVKNDLIPLLVMGCNRVSITKAIDPLFKHRPNETRFPIFVSLGCNKAEVLETVKSMYGDSVNIWQYPPVPDNLIGTHNAVTLHYYQALKKIFENTDFNQVIILEDDLEISPDFFSYFIETLPLMYLDPSLYCISSWNDQGMSRFTSDPSRLLRTDSMPGLGWLLTRVVFESISPFTQEAYWDNWMRNDAQRKGRQCIIPEMPRNRNFGKEGTSAGQWYDEYIATAAFVNESLAVDFGSMRLYLTTLMEPTYQESMVQATYLNSALVSWDWDARGPRLEGIQNFENATSLRVEYGSEAELENLMVQIGLFPDRREGVFRSSYRGIVSYRFKPELLVYLVPREGFYKEL
ncbi:glycosyl transferase [Chytriomyces sp. MP71]|nr:glycosyl transferase [Chytriomyces sp. MP71]